jgi:predicted RNase H-like HicB family nuclease
MAEYSFTVLFEPAEEGSFVVTCPALPGLVTKGDTLEEARAMAQDAIRGYIESLQKDHSLFNQARRASHATVAQQGPETRNLGVNHPSGWLHR